MPETIFRPARILLPQNIPLDQWAVVACDQFSSQPAYWEEVRARVKGRPSAFHLVFPECWLESADAAAYIAGIHGAMDRALADGTLGELPEGYLYCQRTLSTGQVRHGLVGALDLERYSYRPQDRTAVRATEGTVTDRLPPRMAVRRGAALELPHVLVLLDDREKTVLEPLAAAVGEMVLEYESPLMLGGGSIRGWRLGQAQAARAQAALAALEAKGGMVYAVGDGNHSLAAAKECFEELKKSLPREVWERHPARYALVELGNLYDPSLVFEPIHRVVTGVDPGGLVAEMTARLGLSPRERGAQRIGLVATRDGGPRWITKPSSPLAVGSVQAFLDEYLAARPGGTVDYIHGEEALRELVGGRGDALGLLLPPMPKEELFPAVEAGGVLPRKTFSMGHARDKRYYLEGRKIR